MGNYAGYFGGPLMSYILVISRQNQLVQTSREMQAPLLPLDSKVARDREIGEVPWQERAEGFGIMTPGTKARSVTI